MRRRRGSPHRPRGSVGARGQAGAPVPNCPLLCLQRSFTLIVEAWDWDNDTTPDGEFAGSWELGGWGGLLPAGPPQGTGRRTPYSHRDAWGQIPRPLPAGDKGPDPRKAAPTPKDLVCCFPLCRGCQEAQRVCDLQSCACVLTPVVASSVLLS